MITTRLSLVVLMGAAAILSSAGCRRRSPEAAGVVRGDDEVKPRPVELHPAGSTCRGRDDCASDQVCVEGRCRYRFTSAAGEIYAAAARAQYEAGDLEGAKESYDRAVDAYDKASTPIPSPVLCGRAETALQLSLDEATREDAASAADRCLRSSLPGDPNRQRVLAALARLRHAGLAIEAFDEAQPDKLYFREEPTRPTVDAVAVDLVFATSGPPGVADVRSRLESTLARAVITDCFVESWEANPVRELEASLLFVYSTRPTTLGLHEVYVPVVDIEASGRGPLNFDVCLADALHGTMADLPRRRTLVSWQEPFTIRARLD